MDFQQLITLQKLDREKSFSRTSKELGISQPTVTTRIQSLEKGLDESLVLRTGQKAILTDAGKKFLSYVDRALQVYQLGIDRVANLENTVSVAATPTINTYILPQKLKEVRKLDPKLKWKFITGSSPEIVQMVKDEISDIGLIRGTVEDGEVISNLLFEEELHLVCSRHHPLTHYETVAIHELSNESILVYRRLSDTYQLISETFSKEGVPLNVTMELEHVITVKQMVLAGMGVAFLPESAIKKEIESGQLVKKELETSKIIRGISIVLKKENVSDISTYVLSLLNEIFNKDLARN